MNEFQRKLRDMVGENNYVASFADPKRDILLIEPYSYVIDWPTNTLAVPTQATITNAAAATFLLPMEMDSDFVCSYFSGQAKLQGTATLMPNPAIGIQIQDKSVGRNLFDQPMPMAFIAGQGGFPFILTAPFIVKARSTIQLTAQALQNVTYDGLMFVFHGSRIYYR